MDPVTLETLLTVGGAATLTTILTAVILGAAALAPAARDRFGPLIAIVIGVVVTEVATFALGLGSRQDVAQAGLTGVLAGASSMGLYDTLKGVFATPTSP